MTVTPEIQAELRRLLDAAETPWALWDGYGPDGNGDMRVARIGHLYGSGIRADPDSADIYGRREAFELLASAVNALPALLDAAAERDALAAKVARVRALHRAVGIYDECDCDAPDPATHLDVDDVGLTCNLMYRVCAECCRDNMYQTEGCAIYHAHRLDEDYHCPTIRALDEENAQSRAPQHPNPYRQPEGNRA